MELYKRLSENYDELFPVSQQEIDFLQHELTGKTHLLDIGCGTGSKTVRLAQSRKILGIDQSPTMIDLARKDHADPNVDYLALGMEDMTRQLTPNSFDGVVCVGNTMAHLPEPGQVMDMVRQVRVLLQVGGVFVGQIINFDRIISRKVDSLPLIETPAILFRRTYEWVGSEMNFCIELEDKRTGQIERRKTPMRPILKSSLESALLTAGFVQVYFLGSFAGEPFREDSYHLIFVTKNINA